MSSTTTKTHNCKVKKMTAALGIKTPKFLKRNKQGEKEDIDVTEQELSDASLPQEEGKYLCPGSQRMEGSRSLALEDTRDSVEWRSAGEKGHHKHSPWVAQPVIVAQQQRGDYAASDMTLNPMCPAQNVGNLRVSLKRAAELPHRSYFPSCHVLVNLEREKRQTSPLSRSRELDEFARWHVDAMSSASEGPFHAEANDVLYRLPNPCRRIGSNVGVGENINSIHKDMMANESMFNNIVDRRYVEMGMATAKGKSGELYICLMFRG